VLRWHLPAGTVSGAGIPSISFASRTLAYSPTPQGRAKKPRSGASGPFAGTFLWRRSIRVPDADAGCHPRQLASSHLAL